MSKIDFYVLKDAKYSEKNRFACRLCEKAYKTGYKVHLYTNDEDHTTTLNELLWTFSDKSFLPHCVGTETKTTPISISSEVPLGEYGLLINLTPNIPEFLENFARTAEIISESENDKKAARERYSYYREQGYTLNSHEITI
jgi:DNA polymerase-3 subunit chi